MGAATGLSQSGGGGAIGGSGVLNYLAKWTPDGTTLGLSLIRDDGASVWWRGAGSGAGIALNTAFGLGALINNSNSGIGNTGFGYRALYNNTDGTNNVAIGSQSLISNTIGYDNVGLGYGANQSNETGSNNTAIGYQALSSNLASDNVAVGHNAIFLVTTGVKNSVLGAETTTANPSDSGNVILGYGAASTGNNQFVVGSATTNAGVVTAEAVVSDATWTVIINGTAYKILLKA